MALKLDDKPDHGVYDNDQPGWRTPGGIGDLERSFGAPSAKGEDLPDGHPDKKSLDSDELGAKESKSDQGGDMGSPAGPSFSFKNEGGKGTPGGGILGNIKGRISGSSTGAKVGTGIGVGGGILILGAIIMLMFFLSSLKVVNFGEVMSVAGYARFRGVTQERMTQDLFDSAAVTGDGTVKPPKGTLVDRILLRNVQGQIADLGREGQFKFITENGELVGAKIGGTSTTLDGVSKDLGFGDSYKKASYREKLTIRNSFVDSVKTSASESQALGSRYVESAAFDAIAKDVGFKFGRWPRTVLRDFLGKTPKAAAVDDGVTSTETTSGDKIVETGVGEVDLTAKQLKNQEKLKKFLEKNGREFDEVKFLEDLKAGDAKANGISEATSKLSMGVLIMSLACMANQTFKHSDDVNRNNEIEAVRMGLQLVAARDQIKADDGVNSLAMYAAATQVDGGDKSPAYQQATGRPITPGGADDPRIRPDVNPNFAATVAAITSPSRLNGTGALASTIPGGKDALDNFDKEFCDKVLSPGGALTIAGIEIIAVAVASYFSGGGAAALEQGGGRLAASTFVKELATATFGTVKGVAWGEGGAGLTKTLGTMAATELYATGLKFAATSLSSTSFSGTETGGDYVQRSFVGTNVLQNRQLRGLYGRPLTAEEANDTDATYAALDKKERQKQSVFARYLSPHNPYSITGSMAMATPSSVSSGVMSFRTSVTHVASSLQPLAIGGFLQKIIPGLAHPVGAMNYDKYNGVEQWGWSKDERAKMRDDPTYSIRENDLYITPGQISQLDSEIGACFDPAKTQFDISKNSACSREKLSEPLSLRYRIYKLDSWVADTSKQDLGHVSDVATAGVGVVVKPDSNQSGEFGWPITNQSTIYQCYTWNGSSGHPGLDITGPADTPVFAIADGEVDNVKNVDGYGPNFVSIVHSNGYGSSYGHMKSATVKKGQIVKRGDQVGVQGNIGNSGGDHIHINLFKGAYSGWDTPNIDPLMNGMAIPTGVNNPKGCK